MWPFQPLPKHSATKTQRRILLKEKHTVVCMTGFPTNRYEKFAARNQQTTSTYNLKTNLYVGQQY